MCRLANISNRAARTRSRRAGTRRRFGFVGPNSAGLSSIELAMFVSFALVVASFGVPRFRDAVERSKAGEAFHYLNVVRVAEARNHARFGSYTVEISEIATDLPTLKFFVADGPHPGDTGLEDSWRMTLTRRGPAAGYGAYTVTYTQEGFEAENSSIVSVPSINPLGEVRIARDERPENFGRSFAEGP